jgi:hypothetical protein
VSVTGGILQRIERRHRFVDNHDVCHWLVFVTQLSERVSTPAVQWARVEDGRIVSIELLFDPHRYRQLFDVDGGNREDASAGPALIVATVSSPDRSGPGGRCASAAPQTDAVATEPTPLTESTGPRRAT